MNKTSWEKAESWYHKLVGEKGHYYHQRIIIPKILEYISKKKNVSLLDLGCGQGILSRTLPSKIEYYGIDISSSLIKKAKRLEKNINRHFIVGDITKQLSIKKKDFDYVIFLLSLQNIKDGSKAIKNAALYLKKGGKVILALNHPCFRIPRQSSWEVDKNTQYRRINAYMSPLEIPIKTHPSKSQKSEVLFSYHCCLSTYASWLFENGFSIERLEELISDKKSRGSKAKMENRVRREFPLFLVIITNKS